MKKVLLAPVVLLLCVVLSGCATMAASTPDPIEVVAPDAIYDRLPADYELPPYIRIAALPLAERPSSQTTKNTALLGDYWLFSNTGYTLDVGALPSIDAANAYIAHHDLAPDAVRFIQFDRALGVSAFYGHFQTREIARKALGAFAVNSAQITSIRALKARRCETINTPSIDALCNGAPVKTLRIAEVIE